jgi:hypothetical protein
VKAVGAIVAAAVFLSAAIQVRPGEILLVRLTTPVSSKTSKVSDPVEFSIVSPIARASILNGHIRAVTPAQDNERAYLDIEFEGAQLIEVDNARESVDQSGRIIGIGASASPEAQINHAIEKLGERYVNAAGVLQAAKTILVKDVNRNIEYPAGVEMRVRLTRPLSVHTVQDNSGLAKQLDLALENIVRQQPVRAQAQRPALPSDWTNVVFIGTRENIECAFKAAGWSPAAETNAGSIIETARAIIESRGYQEAPVSKLRLDGRLPDLVFEKMNNTFAKRHHLRVWLRREKWQDQQVWIGAATHDNGIAFAPDERAFFHTIEPDIDLERQKVVDDLTFTGLAKQVDIIGRPSVPIESTNATGDRMVTDGKIAVLSILSSHSL